MRHILKWDYRFYTVGTVIFAFTIGACSVDQSHNAAHQFSVALLTSVPATDRSWNEGAYEGLIHIRDSLNAKVSHVQVRTPAEFDENLQQYGAKGYDLVFAHGLEFQDAVLRVAPRFPRTIYITTSGTSTAKNVAGIKFTFEEASYLAGMVAGAMTKTTVVGMVGGTPVPPVKKSFAAFSLGVHTTNPHATTIISYIGNWDDISAGKEEATTQIDRNADIIFQNAGIAGLGVFQAVKESKNIRVIGSNSNQNEPLLNATIGNVIIDLPKAFLTVAREVQGGKFKPRIISLGLHDDIVKFVFNPRLESTIPEHIRMQVDSTHDALDTRTAKTSTTR
jgi:basic membrane protein A and related proteins